MQKQEQEQKMERFARHGVLLHAVMDSAPQEDLSTIKEARDGLLVSLLALSVQVIPFFLLQFCFGIQDCISSSSSFSFLLLYDSAVKSFPSGMFPFCIYSPGSNFLLVT